MTQMLTQSLSDYLAARRIAKRREVSTQVIAAILAALCMIGSVLLMRPINAIRKERQLVVDPTTIKGLPPSVSLLGKLGTFRALVIDWAAIRAERLKEQGKHYEALELHKTVCRLAPRFPKVWVNAAWNMAYNISVTQYTPEARWQWVQNGLKLLRDEGIPFNPRNVSLYKELAWIYWHKIGDNLDDEHLNYKRAVAVEMERVLGAPPVAVSVKEYYGWFKRIVDAPRDLNELVSEDEGVARFVSRLKDVQLNPDELLLEFVARNLRPELRPRDVLKEQAVDDSLTTRRLELLRDPKEAATRDRLLAAVRSKVLREQMKFDLDAMYELMVDRFGPLDWRNAFSHSLYWADRGDRLSKGYTQKDPAEAMNTARFILFSLQNLITRGKVTLWPNFDEPFDSYIDMTPDTRFIPYLYAEYLRLGKELFGNDPRFKEGTPGPNFMVGFVSNMQLWIQLLYMEGGEENEKQAENFLAWLRKNNPHPDGSTQERYLTTLDGFVMGEVVDQMQTTKAAGGIIKSFIDRGLRHFCLGETRTGVTALQRGRLCYNLWMKDTKVDINDRRKMQPYRILVRDTLEEFMKKPEIQALFKASLWKELPYEQRQPVYDRLRPYFEQLCESQKPPWSVTLAFPEPPGMEEFRNTEVEYRAPARQQDIEQGKRDKE